MCSAIHTIARIELLENGRKYVGKVEDGHANANRHKIIITIIRQHKYVNRGRVQCDYSQYVQRSSN